MPTTETTSTAAKVVANALGLLAARGQSLLSATNA